ncbi:MAG TPA: 30S ribosome-binding factor RbfA [Dehalococcoidia bacterium]|jgi:ribosome-binding factor A
MTKRTDRVNELLRDEIAELLRKDIRDPRIGGMVSVTHVDVSPDLRRAHAFVSVFGTDSEREGTMRALESARPFVRRELSRRLHLRYIPDVEFVSDRSIERAQELTDQMRENARERGETI